MSAIRLARGVTGRDKIIKFDGCYHVDALLVKAGSGLATLGVLSAGVPEETRETLVLPLNDLEACIAEYKDQISAGCRHRAHSRQQRPLDSGRRLLAEVRRICTREGILLLFDEVISGFRVGFEGAAGLYDIQPDVLAFGKIVGGGLPVEAPTPRAPKSCNTLRLPARCTKPARSAATAWPWRLGVAQLTECLKPGFYEDLDRKAARLVDPIVAHAQAKGYNFNIFRRGSIFWLAFSDAVHIRRSDQIDPDSMAYFSTLHAALLDRGIYLGPSGYGWASSPRRTRTRIWMSGVAGLHRSPRPRIRLKLRGKAFEVGKDSLEEVLHVHAAVAVDVGRAVFGASEVP